MKRLALLTVFLLTLGYGFSAASQVEFVASLKNIDVESPQVANLTMQLTPTYELNVRVTEMTEIRGDADAELSAEDLEAGMILKIEGVFTDAGILAKEIQVFEGVAEFEVKGTIESVNPSTPEIRVLGLAIKIDENTEITDGRGGELTLDDLEPGQLVKVEGRIEDGLLATEIKVHLLAFRPPRIAFEGIVTSITGSDILVMVEGVDNVLVRVTDGTQITGELAVGVSVRVIGVIQEDLSVAAGRIVVQRLLQLAPTRLHMKPGQTQRVVVILHTLLETATELAVASLDPAVAEPKPALITVPAGRLTAVFEVEAKAPGSTAIEVTLPPDLGGAKATVQVQVEEKGNNDSQKPGFTATWLPARLKLWTGQSRGAMLVFRGGAVAATDITLTLIEGAAETVQFPATISAPAGARFVTAEFKGLAAGQAKIRATVPALPEPVTADLIVEVKSR